MKQSIYKRKRRKNGVVIKSRTYYGKFKLSGDTHPQVINLGVTDADVARKKLMEIVQTLERERCGLIPVKSQRDAAAAKFCDLVKEFIRERAQAGRNARYLRQTELMLERLSNECHWKSIKDINADSFLAWRSNQKSCVKTQNDYLTTARNFINWLRVRRRALDADPLASVQAIQAGDPTYERRALTILEIENLLRVSGPRAVIYLLAIYTGLRRSEIKQLRWSDIYLDVPFPFLRLRASTAKNRQKAERRLRQEVIPYLKAMRDDLGSNPSATVFEGIFPKCTTFKKDLEKAEIPRWDNSGRKVDFHSLRHTFGTLLTLSGALPRVTMEAMRHSDIRLTMSKYTDVSLLPLNAAVESIPSFPLPKWTPKGTSISDFSGHEQSQVGTQADSVNTAQSPINAGSGHDLAFAGTDSGWCAIQGSNL